MRYIRARDNKIKRPVNKMVSLVKEFIFIKHTDELIGRAMVS